ncbi:MAG: hypothetical protein AB1599_07825 [Planctomycetota bacterium]
MRKAVVLFLFVLFGAMLWAADNGAPPSSQPAESEDITLVKSVFKKMEEATAKEDINAYMEAFSKRVELENPDDGSKLSYNDIKDAMATLFDDYDFLKDEQTKDLTVRIKDNLAEVVSTYRLSGMPKGGKEIIILDEGSMSITLQKLPSFSPKLPSTYQIIAVSYILPAEPGEVPAEVGEEDKTMLLQRIKENYGVDLEASGGFEQYRSLLLQELKAESDANKEELEARINILKKRLQKTFSAVVKQDIQEWIQESERILQQVPAESEITSIVDNEIADLKDIFLKK